MAIVTINPATGEKLSEFRPHSIPEVNTRLAKAEAAFLKWRQTSHLKRATTLNDIARELRLHKSAYAELIVSEMGKPLPQASAEIEKCALNCEFYAKHGARFLADERPPGAPAHRYITSQPLGVVLAIMPWNFPFWQVFRSAAPAIMAGNSLLLKHAANVSGCALAIERIFARSDAPAGLLQILLVSGTRAAALLKDKRIAMVTLTGSTAVGRKVAALAGAALKRGIFELGGSDPYLVLADADLVQAARVCAASRLYNNGQSCIAAKRFIVVKNIHARFEHIFLQEMRRREFSHPMSPNCEIGPMAHLRTRRRLHRQVLKSVRLGAKLLLGGKLPSGAGCYYPPTVLTDVGPGMPAYHEELFGPVAAIIPARDTADAIRIANDTDFGLGAVVFTKNGQKGEKIARDHLLCGNAFVNECVRSHPALPFGGIKQSGHGRELGLYGIREFTNAKIISVAPEETS